MSGSGGVDYRDVSTAAANGLGHQPAADLGCGAGAGPVAMNGPDTGPSSCPPIGRTREDRSSSTDQPKCRDYLPGPCGNLSKGPGQTSEPVASKNERCATASDENCSKTQPPHSNRSAANCREQVGQTRDDTAKIVQFKSKVNATESPSAATATDKLTNGCCHHCPDKVNEAAPNRQVQESATDARAGRARGEAGRAKPGGPAANGPQQAGPGPASRGCSQPGVVGEPLANLSRLVERICLDGAGAKGKAARRPPTATKTEPCTTPPPPSGSSSSSSREGEGAACKDSLGSVDQPFGVAGSGAGIIGPADPDLASPKPEPEELPSSLSDFVLGCPGGNSGGSSGSSSSSQYPVPAAACCPEDDSDIDTIRIRSAPSEADQRPVTLVPYKSELQMPDIMRLITKDLSEPYSIYTYRYFIHNWPQLCFLAMHGDKCVGAIVCKLDVHKKMARRGYIAMLAVDEHYRKLQIGSSLVKKAIRAMVRGECDEVVLETEITNKPALKLYENLGFLRDKRLFRYYLNGVDALRLKLWLR